MQPDLQGKTFMVTGANSGIAARVASPRVLKPGEERILQFLLSLDCAILVRSSGMLLALSGQEHPPLIGDFSLNAANSLAAETYLAFGPDTLPEARNRCYHPCHHCRA